jgi:membrane-bound lytic murein transglycosylase B
MSEKQGDFFGPKGPFSFVVILVSTLTFFGVFSPASAQDSGSSVVSSRRAQLEEELKKIEAEINVQKTVLQERQLERVSLERDIAILDAKIEKAKLSIRARNIAIQKLESEIKGKEGTINQLSDKLEKERQSLSEIMRKTNEIDQYTMAEIVLSGKEISEFFEDLDAFESLKVSLRYSYDSILQNKTATEEEKAELESKKSEEIDLRKIQELEKKRIEEQEAEKQKILKISKGVEATYQQIIKSKEKDAAAIRTELFTLRGSAAIPFEKAYEYAVRAGKKTGVRPAFILGIIAEESNLGENVGTGNWRVDMKAPRDTVPFQDICARLGLDPDKMPVSKKPWYGYGGAMGPAQFIPSTWILYEDRIAQATGHNPPNPWDPEDAFMASAILLADNGASKGTYAAERLAALRYLAGWANATKPAYAFYGDDVMELAAKYQSQIDILES